MKKFISIFIFIIAIVMVFVFLYVSVYPRMLEKQYIETQNSAVLYKMCKISLNTKKTEIVLKYCPKLFNEQYILSDSEEKDEMLSKYLTVVLYTEDFELYKNSIAEASSKYSSVEMSVLECTRAVYEYYYMTGKADKTLVLFDALIEKAQNIEIKDLFYTKKSNFLMSELEDFEAVKEMQEERKKLKDQLGKMNQ